MPAAIAPLGERAAEPPAVERDAAGVAAVDAEDRPRDLGAAGADQPGERDDLARPHVERDVGEDALARQALDLEHGLADASLPRGRARQLAADHRADDVVAA